MVKPFPIVVGVCECVKYLHGEFNDRKLTVYGKPFLVQEMVTPENETCRSHFFVDVHVWKNYPNLPTFYEVSVIMRSAFSHSFGAQPVMASYADFYVISWEQLKPPSARQVCLRIKRLLQRLVERRCLHQWLRDFRKTTKLPVFSR